ncbi:uncharacterized protein N7503_001425 [Penicillium pulvis]|uniref:uncharacterized protein n=1 Tax=Penicillium pulvis TaxID=1562058 RepID=UPI002549BCCF|nr:uncharacterized protein N7503_001425 [Penicillium pulvis]KAJ5809207.1 hypothetical protein N7503_001425 [Penicillium pulvis]
MPYKEWKNRFSFDFDSHGEPRGSRVPKDPPMIIWAHGLPWFPVFKDVYLLGIIDVGALTGRLIVHIRTDLPVIAIASRTKATFIPLPSRQFHTRNGRTGSLSIRFSRCPRGSRVPKGNPPMIIWAHGLPWFPVFKDVYILGGSWCKAAGYLLQTRTPRNAKKDNVSDTMSLGYVLAPPAAVEASKAFSSTMLELRKYSSILYDPDITKGIVDVGALTGRLVVHPSVAAGETPTFSDQDFVSQGFANTAGNTFVNVATQIGTPDPQGSQGDGTEEGSDDSMGSEELAEFIKGPGLPPKSPPPKSPGCRSPRSKSPRPATSQHDKTTTEDKPLTRLGWWIVNQKFSAKVIELIRYRVSLPEPRVNFLISNIREGDPEELLRALSLSSELQVMGGLINDSSQSSGIKDAMSKSCSALTADLIGFSTEELVQRP